MKTMPAFSGPEALAYDYSQFSRARLDSRFGAVVQQEGIRDESVPKSDVMEFEHFVIGSATAVETSRCQCVERCKYLLLLLVVAGGRTSWYCTPCTRQI